MVGFKHLLRKANRAGHQRTADVFALTRAWHKRSPMRQWRHKYSGVPTHWPAVKGGNRERRSALLRTSGLHRAHSLCTKSSSAVALLVLRMGPSSGPRLAPPAPPTPVAGWLHRAQLRWNMSVAYQHLWTSDHRFPLRAKRVLAIVAGVEAVARAAAAAGSNAQCSGDDAAATEVRHQAPRLSLAPLLCRAAPGLQGGRRSWQKPQGPKAPKLRSLTVGATFSTSRSGPLTAPST